MTSIGRLRVYPIKGLDGIDVERSRILDGGTLAFDREFALFESDEVLNGKRTDRVHDLATDFEPETGVLSVEPPEGDRRAFDLEAQDGRTRAESWFSDFFDRDLTLRRNETRGFVDRPDMGPSVVSTATLEAVASWFEEITVAGARRRLRANVEVSGVLAFWEDRFVGKGTPAFQAGGVRFEGVTPCGRCVVPERDPETGEPTPNFRERFVEMRKATRPAWFDELAFEHYYTLMIITSIPERDRGQSIAIGDPVTVRE